MLVYKGYVLFFSAQNHICLSLIKDLCTCRAQTPAEILEVLLSIQGHKSKVFCFRYTVYS